MAAEVPRKTDVDPALVLMADRFEQARKALGFEQRPLGRSAKLRHDTDYGLAIARLKAGGSPGWGDRIVPIVEFFATHRYRVMWLLFGEGPPKEGQVAGLSSDEEEFLKQVPEAYRKHAPDAVATLVRRGWPRSTAWVGLSRFAMKEQWGIPNTSLDIADAVEPVLGGSFAKLPGEIVDSAEDAKAQLDAARREASDSSPNSDPPPPVPKPRRNKPRARPPRK